MKPIGNHIDQQHGITDGYNLVYDENYIPVDDDGVWHVSTTTMNLLYAMFLWADKNGIDTEDDWDAFVKSLKTSNGESND